MRKIRDVSEFLGGRGITSAEREAELIIRRGLGMDAVTIYRDDPSLTEVNEEFVSEMALRRSMREPLQYILGSVDFMGLEISVGKGVLIPRPETELLVEQAVKIAHSYQLSAISKELTILDLCTGSGCIALALASEFRNARVLGVDISDDALSYAIKNAEINGILNASFIKGDLFKPLSPNLSFDLIISNPPYIKSGDISSLQPEISEWEPLNALDGGHDGLLLYRKTILAACDFLNDKGMLIFELGAGCAEDVVSLMKSAGYINIETMKDYAGIERIVSARWTR
ncbi:MAG: peptide chain release factor N(5)-glutamine methyltransferase [Nitrospirae bacterium]|nr:peptide chain release factor N(5)-glutamine methyltransferase [Nitrospirota bacterium]